MWFTWYESVDFYDNTLDIYVDPKGLNPSGFDLLESMIKTKYNVREMVLRYWQGVCDMLYDVKYSI